MKRSDISYLLMLAVLVGAAALSVAAGYTTAVPPRRDFAQFPAQIGEWRSAPLPDFDERTLKVLGVSDYVNRVYRKDGKQASLYVGYYRAQRAGESIHSPKNCLPGNGYEVLDSRLAEVDILAPARSIPVNFYILQRDQEQAFVLYWYETHGRVFAKEYLSKAILVWEALRTGRTDGALVRVTVSGPRAESQAIAIEFAREVFPVLRPYLAD